MGRTDSPPPGNGRPMGEMAYMVRSLGKYGKGVVGGMGGGVMSASSATSSVRDSARGAPKKTKLGTFQGVFIPTIQNILGIILFLRVPFIVGQAGILQTLIIVWLSVLTAFLTSVSMSAVATNGVPQGGGCYSIIKNSLGPQFGGVTGILLFLANTFGVAMYVLGCVEVLNQAYPTVFEPINDRVLGLCILGALGSIVFVGIKYIANFAVIFMAGVIMAIVSLWLGVIRHSAFKGGDKPNHDVTGLSWGLLASNWGPRYTGNWDFASCLAIFYPAVTDPLAGSNLSGDLRDPQKSIPPGTLAAVACAAVVFTIQIVLVAGGTVRRAELRDDYFIVQYIAWPFEECAIVGVLLSTLGAGLQSIAGAPRLLAALGRDQLIPALSRFAPANPEDEPRAALGLCVTLSACCVLIGDLNLVAPLITMWFMSCYTIINFACAWLSYERTPSFRPSFHWYHWRVSAFGVVLNLCMMFYMSWYYAIGALSLAMVLYKYIERQLFYGNGGGVEDFGEDMGIFEVEAQQISSSPHSPDGTRSIRNDGEPKSVVVGGAVLTAAKPKKSVAADWRSGLRFAQARTALLALEARDLQFKYWRPFVLFFCKLDEVEGRYVPQMGMINLLAQLMKSGRGIALVNGVIVSAEDGGVTPKLAIFAEKARRNLRALIQERHVDGFADVVVADSEIRGQRLLVQSKGLGFFRPNTVMLGWPKQEQRRDAKHFAAIVEEASVMEKTVLVCAGNEEFPSSEMRLNGRIDVWWVFDLFPAGGLLLLLPFLLMKDKVWHHAKLRLVVVSARSDDADNEALDSAMRLMLKAGGVLADVIVLHVRVTDAPEYAGRSNDDPVLVTDEDTLGPLLSEAPSRSQRLAKMTGVSQNSSLLSPSSSFKGGSSKVFGSQPSAKHLAFQAATTATKAPLPPSKLSALIKEQSGDTDLIVISLPRRGDEAPDDWMDSIDKMLKPLKRVMFVKESGAEKVQFVM